MKKSALIPLLVLVLSACSAATPTPEPDVTSQQPPEQVTAQAQLKEEAAMVQLQDLGTAPELENEIWLNSEQPLRLEELRGNVVLLEMWTYG